MVKLSKREKDPSPRIINYPIPKNITVFTVLLDSSRTLFNVFSSASDLFPPWSDGLEIPNNQDS